MREVQLELAVEALLSVVVVAVAAAVVVVVVGQVEELAYWRGWRALATCISV